MKLKAYLEEYGITGTEFADKIGVQPSAVSNYVTGFRTPKRTIATRIVKETRNLVSYADLYSEVEAQ